MLKEFLSVISESAVLLFSVCGLFVSQPPRIHKITIDNDTVIIFLSVNHTPFKIDFKVLLKYPQLFVQPSSDIFGIVPKPIYG